MNRRSQNARLRIGTLLLLCLLGFPFACDALDHDSKNNTSGGGDGGSRAVFPDGGRFTGDGHVGGIGAGATDGRDFIPSNSDGAPQRPPVAIDGGTFPPHGDGASMAADDFDAGEDDDAGY